MSKAFSRPELPGKHMPVLNESYGQPVSHSVVQGLKNLFNLTPGPLWATHHGKGRAWTSSIGSESDERDKEQF